MNAFECEISTQTDLTHECYHFSQTNVIKYFNHTCIITIVMNMLLNIIYYDMV